MTVITFEGVGDADSPGGRQSCWGGIPARGEGGFDHSIIMSMAIVLIMEIIMVMAIMLIRAIVLIMEIIASVAIMFMMIKMKVDTAGSEIESDKRLITERCVASSYALCT